MRADRHALLQPKRRASPPLRSMRSWHAWIRQAEYFDRDPGIVIALIQEGARRIKADRQKTQTPKAQAARKAKDAAIKLHLKLVIEAVFELSSKRKQHLTGKPTIKQLARVIGKSWAVR